MYYLPTYYSCEHEQNAVLTEVFSGTQNIHFHTVTLTTRPVVPKAFTSSNSQQYPSHSYLDSNLLHVAPVPDASAFKVAPVYQAAPVPDALNFCHYPMHMYSKMCQQFEQHQYLMNRRSASQLRCTSTRRICNQTFSIRSSSVPVPET